jgi:hypothetical protein
MQGQAVYRTAMTGTWTIFFGVNLRETLFFPQTNSNSLHFTEVIRVKAVWMDASHPIV